jgi:hypothetical protein
VLPRQKLAKAWSPIYWRVGSFHHYVRGEFECDNN